MRITTCTTPALRALLASVAAVAAATSVSVPAAHAVAPTGPWVSIAGVYGSGAVADFTAASEPKPGVSIMQTGRGGEVTLCTAGWAIRAISGDAGFLTAGHCDRDKGRPMWMNTNAAGTRTLTLNALQNVERGVDKAGQGHDSALLFLTPRQQTRGYSTEVAPGVKLRGVLSVEQAKALPKNTPVCMNGSRSGVTCGPLIKARDADFEWGGGAVEGDSGAPVFVVDRSGNAMAIGTLQRGPTQTDNYAVYLEPVLARFGIKAVLDEDGE